MDISAIPRHLGAALAAAAPLILTACGSATPPAPQPDAPAGVDTRAELTPTDVDAWLDGFVPAALEREGIPGASVAVVHDGELVSARGFGWADREDRVPVDPEDTLFRIASVSKVVTATAVMQLVEAGEVDLDTDVEEYVDVELDRPVTLRHLLTHTGGFEERVRGLIEPPGAEIDLADTLATDPPEQIYEPGTVPAYSNYGNALAGLVVQEVGGLPFETYVAEELFGPAGMSSSSFAQPLPEELADRLASGYADATSPAVPFETVGTPPAGSLTTSATDMARFMLAHLGEGDADLLRPATLEQMHAPALDEDTLGGLAAAPRMTLGFFDRSRGGRRILEHSGDTDVFHADLALWPDDGTGIFVALNGSGREAASSIELRDGLLEGFADRYYPGDEPAPEAVDPEHSQTIAGTYESSRTIRSTFLAAAFATGQTTISAQDDGRVLVSPGPNSVEPALYEPVAPWTWREVGGSRTMAARVVDGEVEAIGFDSAFAMLPVPAHRSAAVLTPVVGGSALVLVLGTLGWVLGRPVQWVRRRRGTVAASDRAGRTLRVLTRAGVACAALALVGWVVVVAGVMGFGSPPTAVIRGVQLLQVLGLLGVVPAVLRLVDEVRRRAGALRVASAGLVAAALVAVGWAAVMLRLLAPDITY